MKVGWLEREYEGFLQFKSGLEESNGSLAYLKSLPHGNVHHYWAEERRVVNFSTYDYLGLGENEEVREYAKTCIDRYGVSTSASRLVSGQLDIHHELEEALTAFLGTEETITFVSGHATNVMTLGYLFGPEDLLICDQYAHNSIEIGAKLSGGEVRRFRHNDVGELEAILAEAGTGRRVVVCIEGLYSMDGDLPPLPEILALKRRFGFVLYVDEAHSIGTVGATGRGVTEHFGVDIGEIDVLMGTLSKTMGSCGGFVSGTRELIDYLRFSGPGFIFSTGLPGPAAGAALKALQILRSHPEYVADLQRKSRLFSTKLLGGGTHQTPVIPLLVRHDWVNDFALHCQQAGVRVFPISYPAVSRSATRVRFFLSRLHTDAHLLEGADVVNSVFDEFSAERSAS
ncbi:aminotransferase class I/II-fold pyridoxal phosphate-dependent enzyme [Nocardia sp. NPDC052566]|uniref:aminotransferase class I/II-fold pyridoxal phosphate-dependent enzyme n=1 Tax=Nocardia sp. NPDC052566 TaxID=3364330 RepID=UPI0037C5AC68